MVVCSSFFVSLFWFFVFLRLLVSQFPRMLNVLLTLWPIQNAHLPANTMFKVAAWFPSTFASCLLRCCSRAPSSSAVRPIMPIIRSDQLLLKQPIFARFFCQNELSSNSLNIPKSEISVSFTRSSGPGGQNVNKVSTKVILRFCLNEATWISNDVKERMRVVLFVMSR